MNEQAPIHFCKGSLADYQDLLQKQATDPDTLYFCSGSGKGFCLFLGDAPLELYTPTQNEQPQQQ